MDDPRLEVRGMATASLAGMASRRYRCEQGLVGNMALGCPAKH